MSRLEFIKEFDRYKQRYEKRKETTLQKDVAEKWIEGYTDKLYLSADAFRLNYYNDSLKKHIDFRKKLIIASENETFINKYVYNNVPLDENEFNTAFSKSLITYQIQYFKFPSQEKMAVILGIDTIINSPEKFNEIKRRIEATGFYYSSNSHYPYNQYPGLKNIIDSMKENTVSKPIIGHDGPYQQSIYVIYKKKAEIEHQQNSYALELKDKIGKNLSDYNNKTSLYNKIRSYLRAADYEINEQLLKYIFDNYKSSENNFLTNECIEGIEEDIILTYKINNNIKQLTPEHIVYAHNNYPLIGRIESEKQLKQILMDQIIFDYFYADAKKAGFTEDEIFLAKIKGTTNRTVQKKYLKDKVHSNIVVSENELIEFYNKRIDMFKDGQLANVGLLYFKDYGDAYEIYDNISTSLPIENIKDNIPDSLWKKVNKYDLNVTISRDTHLFNEKIVNTIFNLKDNVISKPFEHNDEIVIILKENESGTYIYPFHTVEKVVAQMLWKVKEEEATNMLIESLKSKYKMTIKADLLSLLGY